MEKPYMVKQVITFSDGSETVLNYNKNGNQEEIETVNAEIVETNNVPEVTSEVTASEDVGQVSSETVISTADVE